MADAGELFQAWRVAHRKAHLFELQVMKASMLSPGGAAAAPNDRQRERDEARELRRIANDLFILAMADMKSRADQARPAAARAFATIQGGHPSMASRLQAASENLLSTS